MRGLRGVNWSVFETVIRLVLAFRTLDVSKERMGCGRGPARSAPKSASTVAREHVKHLLACTVSRLFFAAPVTLPTCFGIRSGYRSGRRCEDNSLCVCVSLPAFLLVLPLLACGRRLWLLDAGADVDPHGAAVECPRRGRS